MSVLYFLPSCYFFGMLTILNNKVNYSLKSKYIGNRRIQYSVFNHNNKENYICKYSFNTRR